MKLTIEIEMDNAAFEENPIAEAGRIIRQLLSKMEYQHLDPKDSLPLFDRAGNRVGEAKLTAP